MNTDSRASSHVLGVLGGKDMPIETLTPWLQSADLIIAADSGLLNVRECGFEPNLVLGDFDSLSPETVENLPNALLDLDQETTDCEKLLAYVHAHGHASITLVCSEGDLIDHHLDAIHCALRSPLHVRFALRRGIATIFTGPTQQTISVAVGSRVSLLPITEMSGVTLQGVEWEVKDALMSPNGFRSISNKALQSELRLEILSGDGYLFIKQDGPFWN